MTACVLWAGVASPSLQLLPGIDGVADESIAISLQSAVLGIDDGSGRPAEERARGAAAVLGLSYWEALLVPDAARPSSAAAANVASASPVVRLTLAARATGDPVSSSASSAAPSPAPPPRAAQTGEPPAKAPILTAATIPVPIAVAGPAGTASPASPRRPTPAPKAAPPFVALPATPAAALVQSVEFTTTAPSRALVGGIYAVSATATSGLPVKLSIGGKRSVCKLSGSTVSFREAGTCTVEAEQAGNAKYKEARAQQMIVVVRAPQAITFGSAPPSVAFAGGPAHVVSAASSAGLTVELSLTKASGGACRLSGVTVFPTGAGICTVQADQRGDDSYEPAPSVQQSFTVAPAPKHRSAQSIGFTSTAPVAGIVGGAVYSVAATATSGLPVVFSAASGSAGVCTVTGSTVVFVGEGTCVVSASQAGNEEYLAAQSVSQSFPVDRATQALTFLSAPPTAAVAGVTGYTVAVSATSGLPVAVSVAQTSATVCAIDDSTVTAIAPGTCTIEANQPGDTGYRAAAQVQQSFTVGSPAPSLSDQTVNFTSTPPAGATLGGPAYTLAATASSGLPVAYGVTAGSAGVCTVSGSSVSLVGAGTCTVTADQAGSASYHPAPQVQQSFTVGRASQAISFASLPPVPAAIGDPEYVVAASAGSGLPVAFSVTAGSAGVCSVSGSGVTLVGAGICTVVASQGGNAVYDAAAPVQQAFTVGPGAPTLSPQTIGFTSTAPGSAVVGGATYTVAASASSGLPVVFTIASGSAGVCAISGAVVAMVGPGTCTIDANQGGNASYLGAPQVQQSFTVSTPPPAAQTISFMSSAPGAAVFGGPAYMVSALAGSGLPVSFSSAASSAGVCTVSGSTVTIVGAGTCTLSANQAGNGSYLAAPQVQQSFTVARASQTITITTAPPPVDKHSQPYTISAIASSGLPVTFGIAASSATVCSISGSTVSFIKQGDCIVRANQAGNANYLPAPQAQQTIVVVNHV